MRRLCLLLAAGLLFIGCDAAALEDPEQGPVGGKADDGTDEQLPNLDSPYALFLRSVVVVRAIESGELSVLESKAGVLLDIAQDGKALRMSAQICYVVPAEIGGYQPTLPDRVVRAMAPLEIEGALVDESGLWLVTEPAAVQLGVRLDDPIADPLPTEADHPAVVDQDCDGMPGVSVAVSLWRVYAGVRVIFALAALLEEDVTEISGRSEMTLDTEIYGDNIPFYSARNAAREADEATEVIAEEHSFTMRSYAAEWLPPSCDDLQ